MRPYELIKAKRDGQSLAPSDIEAFIAAYTRGEVPDYQMSAMLMAIYFRGLSPPEVFGTAPGQARPPRGSRKISTRWLRKYSQPAAA